MSDAAAPVTREIRSVLHPTDLTPASTPAFVHALRLATSGRAKLYVLHADPAHVDETDWDAFPAVRRTLTSWGLLEAGSAPGAVFEKLGLQVAKIRMTDRDPVRGILRFLEDHPSDLIVLATEGREGLPRWLHGSVAEPVARSAETLTLFIPHGVRGFVGAEDGTVSLRRLLIPIDRRPQPRWALRAAWEIARLLGAEGATLQLLHVGSELEPSAVPVEPNTFAKIEHLVRTGDVVEQILAVARDGPADLIVMATEGHQGFLDALRGSTTERVLRQAPCPVLAVPSR
ncbi:MAG TPA: universal stress protein [Geminicoccaceae bacterium]|nr:universal stress protein [Geminicoccaceae bacterium]